MGRIIGTNAGAYDTPCEILERRETSQRVGPVTVEWVTVATSFISLKPIGYLKATVFKGLQLEGTTEGEVRLKKWLTAAHRIKVAGVTYAITNLKTDKLAAKQVLLLRVQEQLQ